MAIAWDWVTLPINRVMFERRNLSRSGGQTLTGIEQVVQSSTDFWEAQITVKIRTAAQRLAYRAYKANSFGRVTEWIIPVCEPLYQPGLVQEWDDEYGPDFEIDANADILSGCAIGGNSIVISMADPIVVPKPGHYFSYNNRLYLLSAVTPGSPLGHYTVTFVPKARTAIGIGGVGTANFTMPVCLMRLADDRSGDMDRDFLQYADVQLRFVEVPV